MDSGGRKQNETNEQIREIPLCLKCAHPIDPLGHYCPYCGEATGQLTPYIPFVNLRMKVNFYFQMWHQVWSGRVSFLGLCIRLLMIAAFLPIPLLMLPIMLWDKLRIRKW